ncbi:polyphosphate kinase 1 [Hufsiella ginkgonis]|uniref:Polyphosphate kinase n=1 Tax=Hufsiella ginkgonis TaxID=2695274 RepID=A0A7K1Y135_9SPHI|nr:polyphosphate kinase 1 [Hufsiella ginkgonis]MXV16798.1 polyphosphate kinase 1 [Hufsiella ginkgonis]
MEKIDPKAVEAVNYAFFNRDLSWLSFNERVLLEAARPQVPVLERIKFLSIYSSNLDEFYRVRVPSLTALKKVKLGESALPETDVDPKGVLARVKEVTGRQQSLFGTIIREQILPLLKAADIHLLYNEAFDADTEAAATRYFFSTALAFMRPVALTADTSFFPENNQLYLLNVLGTGADEEELVLLNIPANLPRFHSFGGTGQRVVVFLDDVIKANLAFLFPGKELLGSYSIKVTRDAELELKDEYEGDIADKIEKQLAKRDYGLATRVLYDAKIPVLILERFSRFLNLGSAGMVEGGRYHNLKDLTSFPVNRADLSEPSWPASPPATEPGVPLLEQVAKNDLVVHTPYQSYETVLRFFNEAATDPAAEEIYVTLYRVASDSQIVHSLITAAMNGKKVTVFIELKARFDEANNLKWARRLKSAGVKIIYSISSLKVHAKIALVKRRRGERMQYLGLFSTGNLNESTARFYTDHILLTAHKEMLREVELLFIFLGKRRKPPNPGKIAFKELLVAGFNLPQRFTALIDREIAAARSGNPSGITLKMNNLEEQALIGKLYEASNAGVRVNLVMRGICCLIPGVKGMSANITVKRIVDRYLEHGRIFIFENGGAPLVFMGSADWMIRNIHRRIEVCFPVYDPSIRQQVLDMVALQWADNTQAVLLDEDLQNVLPEVSAPAVRSQEAIYKMLLMVLVFLCCGPGLRAQDSPVYRMVLIGNAGSVNAVQQQVIKHAAANVLPNSTSVLYLGDNVYPRGVALPGQPGEKETHEVLISQFAPMRKANAPVFFIAGEHDWDNAGPLGLQKVQQQWQFLADRQDNGLRMIPANGCPDPVEIAVTDQLTIIAFDSEWWLHTFPAGNAENECSCRTRNDVTAQLEELLYKNRFKVVMLASHHPFKTYGRHGSSFSLASLFASPQDAGHPLYKAMTTKLGKLLEGYPNVVQVSAHDHGQQLIGTKTLQVVTGGGAAEGRVKKGKNTLFADNSAGYVTIDLLKDQALRFNFYALGSNGIVSVFSYKKPFGQVDYRQEAGYTAITADSLVRAVHPAYNDVSGLHRAIFGENYREEWAAPTRFPVIHISKIHGGLKPLSRGGGFQSKSLRLADPTGKEWVIRTVEKSAEMLLPEPLRETFARDVFDDAMSAQHPFSALVVPPIADAAHVKHANPVIGVIAPDPNLGVYEKAFANTVCLLEEREPAGDSDNSLKMLANLRKDNDNSYLAGEFLRARLLDLLIGDWDRHEDQWRWRDVKDGSGKLYAPVPRDRDQALYLNEGLVPWITARSWIYPTLQGFGEEIPSPRFSLVKTRFLNAHPAAQLSHETWVRITREFIAAVSDEVLAAGIARLPASTTPERRKDLLNKLIARRARIPGAMEDYYRLVNKVVDIRASDKNERLTITDAGDGGVTVAIHKLSKEGALKEALSEKTFDPVITREIRLYTGKGNDQVMIDDAGSQIRLRVIGDDGQKTVNVVNAANRTDLYTPAQHLTLQGNSGKVKKHFSADSSNTAFVPVNLYNITMPLFSLAMNADDGLLLSLGFKHTHQEGFRKSPYAATHQLMGTHSFSTRAYKLQYDGEWIRAAGKADFTLNARINAPDNTINFFGRGNETPLVKEGDYKRFYRARFGYYRLDPAFRWRNGRGSIISAGPSLQYYLLDKDDNIGRSIADAATRTGADSLTIGESKLHGGASFSYTLDKRGRLPFTAWGSFFDVKVLAYKGLSKAADSYLQLVPRLALFKSLNNRATIVLAERIGGTVTLGKTAFYQSAFLGENGNLLGYHQYRFAGQHSLYNNLELRVKAGTFSGYIFPGQFGFTGFYDTGRVWEKGEKSGAWHHSAGGGVFVSPAGFAVVQLLAGYSKEGWYPYFTMRFRY